MDISTVITLFSHFITTKASTPEDTRSVACEKKLENDLLKKMFRISHECLVSIQEDPASIKVKNEYIITVGYKNVLILKENNTNKFSKITMISGPSSKIKDIEFVYPLMGSNFIVLKNKGENELLVFNYKVPGDITPSKVFGPLKSVEIKSLNYNEISKSIVVFDISGNKEFFNFDKNSPFK